MENFTKYMYIRGTYSYKRNGTPYVERIIYINAARRQKKKRKKFSIFKKRTGVSLVSSEMGNESIEYVEMFRVAKQFESVLLNSIICGFGKKY